MKYEILLYYLYTHLEDPSDVARAQRLLCEKLGLTGRIIIAGEGLNGTVEGRIEDTEQYVQAVLADPLLGAMHFKRSPGTGNAFPKLSVKVRSEIVSAHLGEQDIDPTTVTGTYISAEQLHQWIHSNKEFYIVDMRNDYEHAVGHFANSILPAMNHFRQLPAILPKLAHLRDKAVVTVCTGGVRCEKASGFLKEHGFSEVYQLQDGIVTYMEKYPHEDFVGQLYVFDGRVTMGFNPEDPQRTIVGICEYCGTKCEEYVNCANDNCHRHFICCATCAESHPITYCPTACAHLQSQVVV